MDCPICKKAGLPDYTAMHTVCPQCNSDLKAFLLLNSIVKPVFRNKYYLFGFGGTALIAILFTTLYFISLSENRTSERENVSVTHHYQDSIHILQIQVAKTQGRQNETPDVGKDIVVHYKIKRNDCTSMIAQFFYNDWRMYKNIETDNNLYQPYTLNVGQVLNIKLKQH